MTFYSSDTCSAEREAGPSLGWTGGEVFGVGAVEGAGSWDCSGGAGVVSGVSFSGILCKINADRYNTDRPYIQCMMDFILCIVFVHRPTLLGVWMGDKASRSVMGNSRPRLLRSSYTYTTPARAGELRKASAHD